MRSEVTVVFGPEQEFHIGLEGLSPMGHEEARHWLDDQFSALDCEPLRASGKVLIADKLLTVARAAGTEYFGNPAWAQTFARAALGATQKPFVKVDAAALSVGY